MSFPMKADDSFNQIFTGVCDLKIPLNSAVSLWKLEYFLVKKKREFDKNHKPFRNTEHCIFEYVLYQYLPIYHFL